MQIFQGQFSSGGSRFWLTTLQLCFSGSVCWSFSFCSVFHQRHLPTCWPTLRFISAHLPLCIICPPGYSCPAIIFIPPFIHAASSSPTLFCHLPSFISFYALSWLSQFLNSFPAHLYSSSHLENFTLFASPFILSLSLFLSLPLDIPDMSKRFHCMCPTYALSGWVVCVFLCLLFFFQCAITGVCLLSCLQV